MTTSQDMMNSQGTTPSAKTPGTQSYTRITQLFGLCLLVDTIVLDQLTKAWMIGQQSLYLGIPWASFTYAENKGIAFSIPLEGLLQQSVTVLLIVVLVGFIIRYATWRKRWLHLSLMLLLGGAIGNAIDRILRGYVVDFIQVGSFPIFNVADSCVTLGVLGVLMYEIYVKPREESKNKQAIPL